MKIYAYGHAKAQQLQLLGAESVTVLDHHKTEVETRASHQQKDKFGICRKSNILNSAALYTFSRYRVELLLSKDNLS